MPLVTYQNARNSSAAIKQAVVSHQMPPWFADPRYGKFSNDPSLTPDRLLISAWVDGGARKAPRRRTSAQAVGRWMEHFAA
jgi:hypothetical protein